MAAHARCPAWSRRAGRRHGAVAAFGALLAVLVVELRRARHGAARDGRIALAAGVIAGSAVASGCVLALPRCTLTWGAASVAAGAVVVAAVATRVACARSLRRDGRLEAHARIILLVAIASLSGVYLQTGAAVELHPCGDLARELERER